MDRLLFYFEEDTQLKTHLQLSLGSSLTVHPAAKREPGGDTGDIEAARKVTGHSTSQAKSTA